MSDDVREQVRDRYAAAAVAVQNGRSGSGRAATPAAAPAAARTAAGTAAAAAARARRGRRSVPPALDQGEQFGAGLYSTQERGELPAEAVLASLGCGNPVAVADLRPGERVLDLGSGGGIDVLLSARRVGPTGRAFGLDMTEEMLALAHGEQGHGPDWTTWSS